MTTNAPTTNGYSTSNSTTPNNYREKTASFGDNKQNYITDPSTYDITNPSAYEIITVLGDSKDKAITPNNHSEPIADTVLYEGGKNTITNSSTRELVETHRGTPLLSRAALIAALFLVLSSCGKDNPIIPEPEKPDIEAPKITRYLPSLEIPESGAPVSTGKSKILKIGETKVAEMTDNKSTTGTRTVSISNTNTSTGNPVQYITENGEYKISVKDDAGNISDNVIINIKKIEGGGNEPLISGLENLKTKELKVDDEVNLLEGISFSNNVDMSSIEIFIEFEGVTTKVEANHVFEFPGDVTIIITYKSINDGKNHEEKVPNYVKPLEYNEPVYETTSLSKDFPMYNYLTTNLEKEYWKMPLTGAEIAGLLPRMPGHIFITGESGEGVHKEISEHFNHDKHGNDMVYEIHNLLYKTEGNNYFDDLIYGNDAGYENLKDYLIENYNPYEFNVISSSVIFPAGSNMNEVNNALDMPPYKYIVDNMYSNTIIVEALDNKANLSNGVSWKQYNQDYTLTPTDGTYVDSYNSTSYNSEHGWKISSSGLMLNNNIYTGKMSKGNRTKMGRGYGLEKRNIIIGSPSGVDSDNQDITNTIPSYSAPLTSANIRNAITVIINNHPLISYETAMDILFHNYLNAIPIIYEDENGNTVATGEYIYTIDREKIINTEVLNIDKIDNIVSNLSTLTKIGPLNNLVHVKGKGILFTIGDGEEFYEYSLENQNLYDQQKKLGNVIEYYDPTLNKKKGGTGVDITFFIINDKNKEIPNASYTITRNL